MSDFWELWSKADAGDSAAGLRVNMLVARQTGQLTDRTGFVDAGKVRFVDDASEPIPDYMGSVDMALALLKTLQDGEHPINLTWKTWSVWECNISNEWSRYGMRESESMARAIVGAWWDYDNQIEADDDAVTPVTK